MIVARVKIIKPGMLTTVQDQGRFGYQQYGVPVSGVMDPYAYRVANLLVGNLLGESVLEVTLMGLELEFNRETVIAVTGGDLTPQLNSEPLSMWKSLRIKAGDRLVFKAVKAGCRSYIAIAGGIDVPSVMGSKSTYTRGTIGGYEGRALKKEDKLDLGKPSADLSELEGRSAAEAAMEYPSTITLRVLPGPQDDAFSDKETETFYSSAYQVTNESDRMGFRLEGPVIEHLEKPDIISDGIAMGAIQVPGHGRPIVMMADRQTTGGYTKIANVITADLPVMAQAKPGDEVRFQKVTLDEAMTALQKMEEVLEKVKGELKEKTPAPQESISLKPGQRVFRITINGITYTATVEER